MGFEPGLVLKQDLNALQVTNASITIIDPFGKIRLKNSLKNFKMP